MSAGEHKQHQLNSPSESSSEHPGDFLILAERALKVDGEIGRLWLRIRDGVIVSAEPAPGEEPAPEPASETSFGSAALLVPDLHLTEGTLSPGFIDIHCHGGGGADFGDGADAARTALAAHRSAGTTTMVASLVTQPVDLMAHSIVELSALVRTGELAGIHLEGPMLSPDFKGAHSSEFLTVLDVERLGQILDAGGDPSVVVMVTLAPELQGSADVIRELNAAGVSVALGHTGATYEETVAAIQAGARVGTHVFNAMSPMHHREPGPALALLENPNVFVEVIADGVHLHTSMLRLVARQAADRMVFVSDAMAAAAAADGEYSLGSLAVSVRDGIARVLHPDGTLGAIAGSTLTVSAAVKFAVERAQIPLNQALIAATANPARALGLDSVGRFIPGARADLVVLDEQLQPTRVMRDGVWLA